MEVKLAEAVTSLKPSAVCTVSVGETKEDTIIVFYDDTVLTKDEIFAERDRLQNIEDNK